MFKNMSKLHKKCIYKYEEKDRSVKLNEKVDDKCEPSLECHCVEDGKMEGSQTDNMQAIYKTELFINDMYCGVCDFTKTSSLNHRLTCCAG